MSSKSSIIDLAYSLDALEPYGINAITSESCGYGGRMLCNLTLTGTKLLSEFFGGSVSFVAGTAWGEGISSVMLPHGIWDDLAVFILIQNNYEVVVKRPDHVVVGYTMEEWDDIRDQYLTVYRGTQVYVNHGTAGTRNTHVWTGRTI